MITLYKNQIEKVIKIINNGEVIALPTDTIFGIVCKFNNNKAINKIYKIKKRDYNKKFPILVSNWEQAKNIGIINEKLKLFLINNFIPGKITAIILKKPILNTSYWINEKTIAVRVSVSNFIQKIIKKTGPLVATSCNLSNKEPINNYRDIKLKNLKYKVFGKILINKPSNIYDSLNNKIIR